jgi:LmbE family N-acetylglucosaminyl deacetylase
MIPHAPSGGPTANPTIAGLGTLLGVWAHPDDEAYLSAGLMRLARRARSRVAVLTATAGEGADGGTGRRGRSPRPHASPGAGVEPRRAGRGRAPRLRAARRHLRRRPLRAGVALVERWMRYVSPDTIVTFGPTA